MTESVTAIDDPLFVGGGDSQSEEGGKQSARREPCNGEVCEEEDKLKTTQQPVVENGSPSRSNDNNANSKIGHSDEMDGWSSNKCNPEQSQEVTTNSATAETGENGEPQTFEEKISSYLQQLTTKSPFFKANPPVALPMFSNDEIQLGPLLGQGEFGRVYEVKHVYDSKSDDAEARLLQMINASSFRYDSSITEHDDIASDRRTVMNEDPSVTQPDNDGEDGFMELSNVMTVVQVEKARKILRKRVWREGKARYAVKQLRKDLVEVCDGVEKRTIGVMDLAMEAKLLSSLRHPNIVKLRGTVGIAGNPNYMLILDRLYKTFDDQVYDWKQEQREWGFGRYFKPANLLRLFNCQRSGSNDDHDNVKKVKFNVAKAKQIQMIHRLYAAYDVARALKHLHQNNLIYRDLKLMNLGFDVRGDVRVFDFGLAKELVEEDLIKAPDEYKCTGMTGSRRWMAPEVYLHRPYGKKADVYSFSLLLWNLCSLQTPFGDALTCDQHYERVIAGGERPPNLGKKKMSESLFELMECGWLEDHWRRTTMEEVCYVLRDELTELRKKIEPAYQPRNSSSMDESRIPFDVRSSSSRAVISNLSRQTRRMKAL